MVKPQLGHDQVVFEYRWSLNTGGHKSRCHSTVATYKLLSILSRFCYIVLLAVN